MQVLNIVLAIGLQQLLGQVGKEQLLASLPVAHIFHRLWGKSSKVSMGSAREAKARPRLI